jgi:inner membrane protein involved in colicin E2 resistance
MSIKKLIAIAIIYIASFIAWMILGVSNLTRTNDSFRALKSQVMNLYGDAVIINAPECYSHIKSLKEELVDGKKITKESVEKETYEPSRSEIQIDINLDQRKKGNLWFPTFKARFSGTYEFKIQNKKAGHDRVYYIYTALGSSNSIYDNIQLAVNNQNVSNILPLIQKESINIVLPQDSIVTLTMSYECTGMENLSYFISPQQNDICQINNFLLTLRTDFNDYDFPRDMMSPIEKKETENGHELIWRFTSSVTGKDIGIIIPNKLNPGEIVSRVTFFAPVSLLFFFIVLFVISIIMKVNIHPMNYFFLAATFFSFHLMYSYFSDHLNIYLTFAIASVVSLLLTVTYMRVFTPKKLAFLYAPLTQFIYLIIFSYSFFFKGMTGIIVTICSVLTLFLLMQITARVDWEQIFRKKN